LRSLWYDEGMRAIYIPLCLAALGSAVACGPAKPADSPSHDSDTSSESSGASSSHAATPPPAPPPQDPATASGGTAYDKEAVETVLKRAAIQVKANCGAATGEDGKATGPWGKTTATVTLGHNGHSRGATVPAPYEGKPVAKCIAQAFAILIFPPFAGGDTPIDWPVEVVAPAGAP